MGRNNKLNDNKLNRDYQVFKEYPINLKSKKEELNQHFIVPWEIYKAKNIETIS